jgi:hypothetical protein
MIECKYIDLKNGVSFGRLMESGLTDKTASGAGMP